MSLDLAPTLAHYLVVSGLVFGLGSAVALSKRNAIAVLMGVELMLNGVNLALVAFSRFGAAFADEAAALSGHAFVVFVLTVDANEDNEALSQPVLVKRKSDK
ncbi:MAG: NADH-quinone oxidoreductase subunit NuoK [Chloroflexi bacterium]|nr:NADH-quinone oxidoreductase subunit NuoK [Chloroflexota bacterium]